MRLPQRENLQANMQPLLIAALSGRMLAASAQRAGRDTMVLDLFNDLDTRGYALHSRAVADDVGHFGTSALLQGANEFYGTCEGIVIGSGFEDKIELMQALTAGRVVYGNAPETVALMKDPTRFFALLDALGIPYPETTLHKPKVASNWLVKQIGASGGAHIQWTHAAQLSLGRAYYQRFVRGRSMSVLFAANGIRAQILGINEQWTVATNPQFPFCYGGAIGKVELASSLYQKIETGLQHIVAASGLVGLNGMDFVLCDDEFFVLEINPRPTATIDLYDDDWSQGLLAVHISACRGELPSALPESETIRAHALVYASAATTVPEHMEFPDWCSDIPHGNSTIALHAPICTVHASGDDAATVKFELDQRQLFIADAVRARVV
jgi:uncharacterized protein